jgi:hypothetical protein
MNRAENKSKGQRKVESVNSPNILVQQCQKMQKNNSLKKDTHHQGTPQDSDKTCCACWENYSQTTNV